MLIILYILLATIVIIAITLFRALLIGESFIMHMVTFLQDYGITPQQYSDHFTTSVYLSDLFNLLDWTGPARARFVADRIYYKVHGEFPNIED